MEVGRCPVVHFKKRRGTSPLNQKRLDKYEETRDQFEMISSFKGKAGITDFVKEFKGFFNKGLNTGTVWIGETLNPLKRYLMNFAVVSTDYTNYAILYKCTYQHATDDKDMILVLTRESPGFGNITKQTEETIRSEFDRLFG